MLPEAVDEPEAQPECGWREVKVGACCAAQEQEHVLSLQEEPEAGWSGPPESFEQGFHFCGLLLSCSVQGSRLRVQLVDEEAGASGQAGVGRVQSVDFGQQVLRGLAFVERRGARGRLGYLLAPLRGGQLVQLEVAEAGLQARREGGALSHGVHSLFDRSGGRLSLLGLDCAELVGARATGPDALVAEFVGFACATQRLYTFRLDLLQGALVSEDVSFVAQVEAEPLELGEPAREKPGLLRTLGGLLFSGLPRNKPGPRWDSASLKSLGCGLLCAVFERPGAAEAQLLSLGTRAVLKRLALPAPEPGAPRGPGFEVHFAPVDALRAPAQRGLGLTLVFGRVARDFADSQARTNVAASAELTLWSVRLRNEQRPGLSFAQLCARPTPEDASDLELEETALARLPLPHCSLLGFCADARALAFAVFDWALLRPRTVALGLARGALDPLPLWAAEDALVADLAEDLLSTHTWRADPARHFADRLFRAPRFSLREVAEGLGLGPEACPDAPALREALRAKLAQAGHLGPALLKHALQKATLAALEDSTVCLLPSKSPDFLLFRRSDKGVFSAFVRASELDTCLFRAKLQQLAQLTRSRAGLKAYFSAFLPTAPEPQDPRALRREAIRSKIATNLSMLEERVLECSSRFDAWTGSSESVVARYLLALSSVASGPSSPADAPLPLTLQDRAVDWLLAEGGDLDAFAELLLPAQGASEPLHEAQSLLRRHGPELQAALCRLSTDFHALVDRQPGEAGVPRLGFRRQGQACDFVLGPSLFRLQLLAGQAVVLLDSFASFVLLGKLHLALARRLAAPRVPAPAPFEQLLHRWEGPFRQLLGLLVVFERQSLQTHLRDSSAPVLRLLQLSQIDASAATEALVVAASVTLEAPGPHPEAEPAQDFEDFQEPDPADPGLAPPRPAPLVLQAVQLFAGLQEGLEADRLDYSVAQNAAVLTWIQLADAQLGRTYARVAGLQQNPVLEYFEASALLREGQAQTGLACIFGLVLRVPALRAAFRAGLDRPGACASPGEERAYFAAGPWFFPGGARSGAFCEEPEELRLSQRGELLLLLLPQLHELRDGPARSLAFRRVLEMRDVEFEVCAQYAQLAGLPALFATLAEHALQEEPEWEQAVFGALSAQLRQAPEAQALRECAGLLAPGAHWPRFAQALETQLFSLLQARDKAPEDARGPAAALLGALYRGHARRGELEQHFLLLLRCLDALFARGHARLFRDGTDCRSAALLQAAELLEAALALAHLLGPARADSLARDTGFFAATVERLRSCGLAWAAPSSPSPEPEPETPLLLEDLANLLETHLQYRAEAHQDAQRAPHPSMEQALLLHLLRGRFEQAGRLARHFAEPGRPAVAWLLRAHALLLAERREHAPLLERQAEALLPLLRESPRAALRLFLAALLDALRAARAQPRLLLTSEPLLGLLLRLAHRDCLGVLAVLCEEKELELAVEFLEKRLARAAELGHLDPTPLRKALALLAHSALAREEDPEATARLLQHWMAHTLGPLLRAPADADSNAEGLDALPAALPHDLDDWA